MSTKNLINLILLAGLWGASFLFMRVSVGEFGSIPLIMMRVSLAALFLLPLVIWKNRQGEMLQQARSIAVVGVFNSAIPFSLIAYSTVYVTAGFASILNAATPMCVAVIAYLWMAQKLSFSAITGLLIGLAGVIALVWDKIEFTEGGSGLAIMAGLSASLCYGVAAVYSKRYLTGTNVLAIATGSQIAASIFLLPLAVYHWPTEIPSSGAWVNVIILALFCTGLAYILYFRLIESAGAANATTVTFLIPVFGMFWGYLFLDESFELSTILACGVILLGTGLTVGLLKFPPLRAKVN